MSILFVSLRRLKLDFPWQLKNYQRENFQEMITRDEPFSSRF